MTGKRQWASDIALVHRLQFPSPVNYLCYATWGACYAVADIRHLPTTPVLGAVAANMLLVLATLVLNTAVDVDTDDLDRGKRDIVAAARRLGRRRCLCLAAVEMLLGFTLAILVASSTHRWLVAAAAGLIIMLHALYNLEPVRLKRRGLAGPAVIGLSFGFLPCLMSYGAVRPTVDTSLWPVCTGLGLLVAGRMAWWSIPDREADRATGITTPAVRYGTNRTLTAAYAAVAAGLGALGWGLSWRYGPAWALTGVLVCGAFLIGQLTVLRRASDHDVPRSQRMRKRATSMVAIGNVLLGTIPLLAS
jgi:lycopene elongase/hydratase (dihydrobisanhydrobacterioruberin-forming)